MTFGKTRLAALTGLMLALTACPLEPDPKTIENCKPGEVQCAGEGYIQECNDDGHLGGREVFLCPAGDCMVIDNVPVCM